MISVSKRTRLRRDSALATAAVFSWLVACARSAVWSCRFVQFATRVAVVLLLTGWPGSLSRAGGAEVTMTEHQVKALCLLNFAKYVTWPSDAFSATNTPVSIGIIGQNKVSAELVKSARNKLVAGRPVIILDSASEADWGRCHIVFIAGAGKAEVLELLSKTRTLPILTVGEADSFIEAGGVIKFVKKDNKVRFEVNLGAARTAGLQISSKLLSLADAVHGKQL
jgi:hypothetical protein